MRVLVVGARVVASMRRRAAPDEFRSNVHRGGRIEKTQLTPGSWASPSALLPCSAPEWPASI